MLRCGLAISRTSLAPIHADGIIALLPVSNTSWTPSLAASSTGGCNSSSSFSQAPVETTHSSAPPLPKTIISRRKLMMRTLGQLRSCAMPMHRLSPSMCF